MKHNIPDRVMRDIVAAAKEYGVEKIILFGSRARGTHTKRSDMDIAVLGGDFDGFCLEIKENAHTLLSFDIVELNNRVGEELIEEIERDGITIYEKDR